MSKIKAAMGIGSLLRDLFRRRNTIKVYRAEGSSKVPSIMNTARTNMINQGGARVTPCSFHTTVPRNTNFYPRGGSPLGNMPLIRSGRINTPQAIVGDMRGSAELAGGLGGKSFRELLGQARATRSMLRPGRALYDEIALRPGTQMPVDVIRTFIRNIKARNFDPSLLQRILKSPEDRATLLKLLFRPSTLAEGGIVAVIK